MRISPGPWTCGPMECYQPMIGEVKADGLTPAATESGAHGPDDDFLNSPEWMSGTKVNSKRYCSNGKLPRRRFPLVEATRYGCAFKCRRIRDFANDQKRLHSCAAKEKFYFKLQRCRKGKNRERTSASEWRRIFVPDNGGTGSPDCKIVQLHQVYVAISRANWMGGLYRPRGGRKVAWMSARRRPRPTFDRRRGFGCRNHISPAECRLRRPQLSETIVSDDQSAADRPDHTDGERDLSRRNFFPTSFGSPACSYKSGPGKQAPKTSSEAMRTRDIHIRSNRSR